MQPSRPGRNAQQLRLESQRQVPNFVQEESSGISHFEAANFLCDGPRKSTLLVSKQFALQEIEGYGSAVELYEWASAARAEIVNGTCDQLFAGAGFSWTRTVESVGATRSTSASTDSNAGLLPTIWSNCLSFSSCSPDRSLSSAPTIPPSDGATDGCALTFPTPPERPQLELRRQKAWRGISLHRLALPAVAAFRPHVQ